MNTDHNYKAIRLDPRLQKCADFVRTGKVMADIGTDHGYLPIALLLAAKVPGAVAADINEAPLESAVRNAGKYGVANRMEFVLSDGLHGLEDKAIDDIVIAGMGGELILRIISEAPWLSSAEKHLVLQPMTTAAQLRCGLAQLGFVIEKEEAVFDGKKIYSVLSVYYAGESHILSGLEEHMGKIVPGSENSDRYAVSVLHNLENKLRGLEHTGGDVSVLRETAEQIRSLYLKEDMA